MLLKDLFSTCKTELNYIIIVNNCTYSGKKDYICKEYPEILELSIKDINLKIYEVPFPNDGFKLICEIALECSR